MNRTNSSRDRLVRGFTLLELLVVIFVIVLLVGLLLPAVQSTRETARRATCMNNLRQLGSAIHQYDSSWNVLPQGKGAMDQSLYVSLLPFLEQSPLYNSFNLDLGMSANRTQQTAVQTNLAVLNCPTDTNPSFPNKISYGGNLGDFYTLDYSASSDVTGLFSNAADPQARTYSSRDIMDGTSQTAAFAEWISGRSEDQGWAPRQSSYSEVGTNVSLDVEDFFARCRSVQGMIPNGGHRRGQYWTSGQWAETMYDHSLPLNSPVCNRAVNFLPYHPGLITGTCSAGSEHPAGTNLCFADGHVRLIRQSINLAIWRAIGTRAKGEIVGEVN